MEIVSEIFELLSIPNPPVPKPDLIRQAFEHVHNENLEFLGDAIFNASIVIYISKYYFSREGEMTRMKSKMVSNPVCYHMAMKLGFDKYLRSANRAITEKKIGDTWEAFIGALFMNLGFDPTYHFIETVYQRYWNDEIDTEQKNYVSIIMEYCQHYDMECEFMFDEENGLHRAILKIDGKVAGRSSPRQKRKQAKQEVCMNFVKAYGVD